MANCKNCPNRTMTCHCTCEIYIKNTEKLEKRNQIIREKKKKENIYFNYVKHHCIEMQRIHRLHK